jgi:hypothetical protein
MKHPEPRNRNVGNHALCCTAIAVYLVAGMTYIRVSEPMAQVDFAIKLTIPIGLVLLSRLHRLQSAAQVVLALYAVLLAYTVLVSSFSEAPTLVLRNTGKFLYGIFFLVALLLTVRSKNRLLHILAILPYLGGLFAMQTIIVFVGVQTGYPPPSQIILLESYKQMPVLSYGWLGFGSGTMALGSWYQVYRAQSFFLEPTRLACFLEASMILGFGIYKATGRKRMLLCTILSAISFVLTFSMTAYVMVFFTAVCYFLVRYRRWMGPLAGFVRVMVLVGAVIVAALYFRASFAFYESEVSPLGMAFGHSEVELSVRQQFLRQTMRMVLDHPFGIGVIGTEDSDILKSYPGAGQDVMAPLLWMKIAGIVGIVLQLVIVVMILRMALRRLGDVGLDRYVGLAFVATVLHQCLAGNWFDAQYFVLLTAVVVTDSHRSAIGAVNALPDNRPLGMPDRRERKREVVLL